MNWMYRLGVEPLGQAKLKRNDLRELICTNNKIAVPFFMECEEKSLLIIKSKIQWHRQTLLQQNTVEI